MRLMVLVLIAALLWPVSVFSANVVTMDAFVKGNDLFRICSNYAAALSFCGGYVQGVADTLSMVKAWKENGSEAVTFCLDRNMQADQIKDIVMQYLTAHPETRHLAAAGEALMALHAALPCKEQAH